MTTSINSKPQLTPTQQKVAERFAYRITDHYASLIDWDNENDPLRRLVMPDATELGEQWTDLDPSDESAYTVAKGCQHKYSDTALLLVNHVCSAYCRYCFRKRLFQPGNDETSLDISAGVEYIRQHREISDVLLTGGDPLLMSPRRLRAILLELELIPHVRRVRIGTKVPAFDPDRITSELLEALACSRHEVALMLHFDHPRELVAESIKTIAQLDEVAQLRNQCPILRGINDNSSTLVDLCNQLLRANVQPYYFFQCRPTAGNESFSLSLKTAFNIYSATISRLSGLARPRFAASTRLGKLEILDVSYSELIGRWWRSPDPTRRMRLFRQAITHSTRWPDV